MIDNWLSEKGGKILYLTIESLDDGKDMFFAAIRRKISGRPFGYVSEKGSFTYGNVPHFFKTPQITEKTALDYFRRSNFTSSGKVERGSKSYLTFVYNEKEYLRCNCMSVEDFNRALESL